MTRISRIPTYEVADKNKIPDLIMDIGYHEKHPDLDKE